MRKRLTAKRKRAIRSGPRLAAVVVRRRRQERLRGEGDGRDGELRNPAGRAGSPRWETSARGKVFSARGKDGACVHGQADVASYFGDGERRRLAFYAERSFRDTQLANLAN
jgi:hypothetical protein